MAKNAAIALEQLREVFAQNAHPEKALGMAKYMKNLFPFVGINSPERKNMVVELRKYFKPKKNNRHNMGLFCLVKDLNRVQIPRLSPLCLLGN